MPINNQSSLLVKVANGKIISSSGNCDRVKVKLLGDHFEANFHMVPLGGCDMVLGVKRLETFGPIVWDFSQMTMQFEVS